MYSNNILNFQESTTILNACTKNSGNLLNTPRTSTVMQSMYSTASADLVIIIKEPAKKWILLSVETSE